MASNDPDFEAKAADIIGLYIKPPQHAAVSCVDEKIAIQPLNRLDPVLPLALTFGSGTLAAQFGEARDLTFAQRAEAREAIERVYYSHRVWSTANRTPKPPFEEVLSETEIQAKVADYLKKSIALEQLWRRPITAKLLPKRRSQRSYPRKRRSSDEGDAR